MIEHNIKIIARYIVVVFFLWLAWDITRPEYLQEVKNLGEIASSSVYASVFGVLGWVVKSNWSTKPNEYIKNSK